MVDRSRGYAVRLEIAAPPALIWSALTESPLITEWSRHAADIDARPSGRFKIKADVDFEREAHIDVFMPPSRLRLIYLPQPELGDIESVIVDDFIIDGKPGRLTRLSLLGSGFPREFEFADFFQRVHTGWIKALNRMKVGVERRAQSGGK
jgi:uncharacterized protein YndB with AHSA1/START domain